MNTTFRDKLEEAFGRLQKHLGENIRWLTQSENRGAIFDAEVEINGHPFAVEFKQEIKPAQIPQLINLKHQVGHLLLVADYIPPKLKQLLKDQGIHYIDAKGNMWLEVKQVYLYVDGIPNSPQPTPVRTRLFAKASLKALFCILVNPGMLNAGYREIAQHADVAVGSLTMLFQGLQEEGYLIKTADQRWILLERERLLDHWVDAYNRRLRPALYVDTFSPVEAELRMTWKHLSLMDGAIWGGEPGADLLTDYLAPSKFTLYADQSKAELMRSYRWKPQKNGPITVYQKFWLGDPAMYELTIPLLVYADLIEAGDARSLEVAQMIYKQHLSHA